MAELNIIDTDFEQVRDTYLTNANEFEELVQQYINILYSITDEKILEGTTSTALNAFTEVARDYLSGEFAYVLETHHAKTVEFITGVFDDDDAIITL